jgi:hypothetical protein
LGTKYDVPSLRSLAIARLEMACPSSLDAVYALKSKSWTDRLADYKVMLILARTCDVPHIMPLCLWQLLPPNPTLNCMELLRIPVISPGSGIEYRLDEATITTLLTAVWRCIHRYGDFARKVFEESSKCMKPGDCRAFFAFARNNMHDHPFDVLQPFRHISNLPVDVLCQRCVAKSKRQWDDESAATWDMVPGFFDLPSWKKPHHVPTSEPL